MSFRTLSLMPLTSPGSARTTSSATRAMRSLPSSRTSALAFRSSWTPVDLPFLITNAAMCDPTGGVITILDAPALNLLMVFVVPFSVITLPRNECN